MMEISKPRKRQVAFKVRIKDLVNGAYVRESGMEPNYVLTPDNKKVSRINLIGTIVAKSFEGGVSYQSVLIDDGTAKIAVREFRENGAMNALEIGDTVLLIGRAREYGNEKYVIPEIMKKIHDSRWIDVRKLELEPAGEEAPSKREEEIEREEEAVVVESVSESKVPKIYNFIKDSDKGDGVRMDDVIKIFGDDSEEIIENLLKGGELFEIRAGVLKVL